MTSTPRPRLLQIGKMPLPALDAALAQEFDVTLLSEQPDRDAFLAAHGASFSYLVTSAAMGAPASVIEALPNLRCISSFGVGFDGLPQDAIVAQGARVGYTPSVLDDCVADLAFALLLDSAREVAKADRFVRAGHWATQRFGIARKVSGKRLGILGMGRIGQQVARRASGFDMEVAYHNRRPVAGSPLTYTDSLQALAQWCDFLVVTAAGGADTRHLVNAQVLQALGADGIVVNVARGSVIDEAALLQALQDGTIAGAGLDVFEDEPRPLAGLLTLDNVVLAPHMASGTHDTRRAMADLVLANLRSFRDHGTLVQEVPWSQEAAQAHAAAATA